MSQRFDSGLPRAQRTLIRRSIVGALGELCRARGGYLAHVGEMASPVAFGSTDDEQRIVEALQGKSPAVLVALGERTFGGLERELRGTLLVHVYACSSHARDQLARVAGDVASDGSAQADPGLEAIGEHLFERLAGASLPAANADRLRPQREFLAYEGQDYTVLEQVYELLVTTDVNPARDHIEIVTEIAASHVDADHPAASPTPSAVTTLEAP